MDRKPKILIFDIETAPSLGYVWTLFETNVIKVIEPWHLLCFSYKWFGEKTIHTFSLPHFKGYKKNPKNDFEITKKIHELFEEADIIIAHNGDRFDIRKVNAKLIQHGFTPPAPYKTIDTLKIAKKYFKFDSNKLNELCMFLGLGKKVETGGFILWENCINGDMDAWKKMEKYNKQDIVLLEKIYLRFRPWIKSHPNIVSKNGLVCHKCGSSNLQWRGKYVTTTKIYRRFVCQNCGGWGKENNGINTENKTSNIS